MGSRVFRKREEKLGYKLKGDVKSSRIFLFVFNEPCM